MKTHHNASGTEREADRGCSDDIAGGGGGAEEKTTKVVVCSGLVGKMASFGKIFHLLEIWILN